MTDCPFCGRPGCEVITGRTPQYRCVPCDVTWSPVPVALPEQMSFMRWTGQSGYVDIPFIDHGKRSVPCP